LADVAWRYGEDAERTRTALLLAGAAEGMRARHGLGREATRQAVTRWQAPMRQAIGDAAVDALFAAGMTLPLDQVIAIAEGMRIGADIARTAPRDSATSLLAAFGSLQ
jgi:hypothetical protein